MTTTASTEQRDTRWMVLTLCAIAQFMVVLDVSIVNVALPQMREHLGLSITGQQWVVNAYTLTFAGFLMLGGRAGDLFGVRRVFLSGLALFTTMSLIGGLAQDGTWLIAARAAQGIGGAVLAPATLTLLTSTFTEMSERRRAMGIWSATAASGAAAGVLFGGILTNYFGWRWVLFVNVPIGVVMFIAAQRALPVLPPRVRDERLDLGGAIAITGGLALFVYGIVSTDTHAWSSTGVVLSLLGGVVLLLAAGIIETRSKDPLVPLGFFKRRAIAAANGIAATIGAALFGCYFFISLYLQQLVHYSPLRTGIAILPAGLLTLFGALLAPRIVARIGARHQLIIAPVIAAIGLIWLSFLTFGGSYWTELLIPLALFSFGLGCCFVPMTLTATAGVPHTQAGLASGLINTTRQVGGAIGLAVLATLATSTARDDHHATSAAAAITSGYDRAFLVAGILLVAGAAMALIIPRTSRAPAPQAGPPAATSQEVVASATS